jgi:aldose 1-epimerase
MKRESFQATVNGKETDLFLLKNDSIEVYITNYGARIVSLLVKKDGQWIDVVMGYDSINDYLTTDEIYHGTIVGRYANRIRRGEFSINGKEYSLPINNIPNHLHGGPNGFHDQVWEVTNNANDEITLSYFSKDGEEGYPGNLQTRVTYRLSSNELEIFFEATTDQPTVLNLTNHAYFNLNGQGTSTILDHELEINANHFTPVDETLIPTGELAPVEATPFDFRKPFCIGERIDDDHIQLKYGGGYDHNYALNKTGSGRTFAARAKSDRTGLVMEVYTEEPGIQLYTGNFLKGANTLKGGYKDILRSGFCLETQHFPDSPNQPHFPSTVLEPGQTFKSSTAFRFVV